MELLELPVLHMQEQTNTSSAEVQTFMKAFKPRDQLTETLGDRFSRSSDHNDQTSSDFDPDVMDVDALSKKSMFSSGHCESTSEFEHLPFEGEDQPGPPELAEYVSQYATRRISKDKIQ